MSGRQGWLASLQVGDHVTVDGIERRLARQDAVRYGIVG